MPIYIQLKKIENKLINFYKGTDKRKHFLNPFGSNRKKEWDRFTNDDS